MQPAEDTADFAVGSVPDLLSATREFVDRYTELLAGHPEFLRGHAAPLAAARAAIQQLTTEVTGGNVSRSRQLRQLDDAFYSRAGKFADALSGLSERAELGRDAVEARVRELSYLDAYRRAWQALVDADATAARFAALAAAVFAELRSLQAPDEPTASDAVWEARRSLIRSIRGFFTDLSDQQRGLEAGRLDLWDKGIPLGPSRVAPPDAPEMDWDWHVPRLSDALGRTDGQSADGTPTGWEAWVDAFDTAVTEWLSHTFEQRLAPYLKARDKLLAGWLDEVAARLDQVDDDVRSADALLAQISAAGADLNRLVAARDSWHGEIGAGLTPAIRVAVAEVNRATRGVISDRPLLRRLSALSSADVIDVCVPIVATMKAGKSTTLGVLLGLEVAPRRSHAMTTLATRYVLTGTVTEPEFSVGAAVARGYDELLDQVLRRLPGSADRLAKYPHLVRLAAGLDRKAPRPPASCRGTEAVLDALAAINDFARLAMLVLPAAKATVLTGWIPEVQVPDASQRHRQARGPRVRIVFVDTPGLGDAAGRDLLPAIVTQALDQADGCVFVMDYLALDGKEIADLADQVKKRFGSRTSSAVFVTVNKIDERKSADDLGPEDVIAKAHHLLGITGQSVPVVETRADLALGAIGCEDPRRLAALARLEDPFGDAEPIGPAEAERLISRAVARSGLDALRTTVIGGITDRGGMLAIESALERLAAAKSRGPRALADPVSDLRWAVREARPVTLEAT